MDALKIEILIYQKESVFKVVGKPTESIDDVCKRKLEKSNRINCRIYRSSAFLK